MAVLHAEAGGKSLTGPCSRGGSNYNGLMRIISVGTLKAFWDQPAYRDAEQPLRTWVKVVKTARWADPPAVKQMFGSADILRDGRVVFDIGGNKYRLVVWVNYQYGLVYVRFIGTHRDYDKTDAQNV
jgi:mRNA interferase HigB